jgi:hypothetical protein
MNKIIKISIRLFLIFIVFQSINTFAVSFHNFISWNEIYKNYQEAINAFEILKLYLPFITVWVIYLFVVIFLWIKSDFITNKIVGENKLEIMNISLDYKNILSVGLIVLGVYLFIDSIPRLFSYISNFAINKTRFVDRDFLRAYTIKEIVEIIGIIIKMITSIMLIKYNEKIILKIYEIKNKESNVA